MTRAEEYTPAEAQAELLDLVVKAARRCAYDLSHAADNVADREMRELFADRAKLWLGIFNPADGPKDYRHRLHHDIRDLEDEVERLRALCAEKGIDPENPRGIPF